MALPEWLLTFLLTTLLPWVISLAKAYIDKKFRPSVSPEGWVQVTGLMQKLYDEAGTKGLVSAQAAITEFFCPILDVTIVASPVDPGPTVQKAQMFKDMAEVATEMHESGATVPFIGSGIDAPIDTP